VIAPVWARFLSTFPDVQLEVHTAEAPVDIVAKSFDAGIGPKDWAAADMIAVRVMGPMKVAVVGAPTYFARRRPPRTPDYPGHRQVPVALRALIDMLRSARGSASAEGLLEIPLAAE